MRDVHGSEAGGRPDSVLTGRQKQILDLLCQHMTSRQVGAALGICARTVDNHCVRICKTLQVSDRFEAVRVWAASQDSDSAREPPT